MDSLELRCALAIEPLLGGRGPSSPFMIKPRRRQPLRFGTHVLRGPASLLKDMAFSNPLIPRMFMGRLAGVTLPG
jgi:hypothetical protein